MTTFFVALIAVGVLLATAVPGYVLIRRRMIDEACIPGASKILLYVCQPCLAIYTLKSATNSPETLLRMGQFALLVIAIHAIMLGGAYLILRKKNKDAVYRIITIATTFGNCAFFGIPILEALFPAIASELIVYTTVYGVIMNVLGWTVGSAIIARDTSYIRLGKVLLNPAILGACVGMLLLCLNIPVQADLYSMITILGRMCSPLSMLIMGMRLATVDLRRVFTNVKAYVTILIKQCVMPLVALLLVLFLTLDIYLKRTFFILACCPAASIVLNFSEIVGEGQRDAAGIVLLGTILSAVTLPLMTLLLPVLELI